MALRVKNLLFFVNWRKKTRKARIQDTKEKCGLLTIHNENDVKRMDLLRLSIIARAGAGNPTLLLGTFRCLGLF